MNEQIIGALILFFTTIIVLSPAFSRSKHHLGIKPEHEAVIVDEQYVIGSTGWDYTVKDYGTLVEIWANHRINNVNDISINEYIFDSGLRIYEVDTSTWEYERYKILEDPNNEYSPLKYYNTVWKPSHKEIFA